MTTASDDRELTELVTELRYLHTAFDRVRLPDMTIEFYIHAFNQYSASVQDLLDALDGTGNSTSEVIGF